ncbi:eukaryotic translation initiation factor 2A isoform X2 [Perognathus longimembris pacificus]|uniref:eukaryotic translation initiation factor 2A isoform X2 n=1 Tax=Perognathus longimembris pacificus TaxID=214514 RepID=UPI002018CE79|nr:eukaryotic translation initiation factor 2A isoform X2 [Perognathus longimembris pacificus]
MGFFFRNDMAPSAPLLTVRGSEGLYMVNGPPHFTESTVFPREPGKNCKVYTFSKDGTLFAWGNGEKVNIINVTNNGLLHSFDLPKVVCLEFSPKSTVLATWQPYTTSKDGTAGIPNLQLYDVKTGACLKSFIQKKMQNWCPSWSDDEIICARNVNNEVHFFENNNFTTAVLVIASTEVDKTGASYYGEQTLHYIATNGESAVVQLPKNGPIYDVVWNSSSTEFCAVYGFMPAKATVFNLKCDPVFDFGTGPRNAAYYSPHGHILVLAGFGNLRGQMEVWDVKNYKLIAKPVASDSTYFAWCPDGEHILTATCAPRLRVNNGYKIWHYTGSVLYKHDVPSNGELWQVSWQPFLDGVFPAKAITYQAVPSEVPSEEPKVATAYRPPALRNKPATNSKLHEEEPPQNMKPHPGGDKPLSKTALKNQRKHEAKKAAKQEARHDKSPDLAPASAPQSTPRNTISQSASGDPEIDRKIKNLKKKLKAIEQLKEQAATGKQLEKNQLEKIQKETALLQELEDLELGV